jgi:phosphoglycolate phosphatase-like HAD superfamily hydrolase
MKQLRGVILDVDGTLVDSNEAHVAAWVAAFHQAGYPMAPDTIRPLIGMGSDTLLPAAAGIEKSSPEGQQLSKLHSKIFESEYLPHVEAFPCTHELLQHMRERGLRLVLASAAKGHIMDTLLEVAGAEHLIEDDPPPRQVHSSKPDPEIVQAALDRLGYARDEVLMIGDTPYDVEAAAKLDIPTIAVRCGGYQDADLAGAVAIYDDPADLLAHYDESPLGRHAPADSSPPP